MNNNLKQHIKRNITISIKLSGFCGVGVTREVGVSLVLVDEEDDLTWQVSAILSVQFLQ